MTDTQSGYIDENTYIPPENSPEMEEAIFALREMGFSQSDTTLIQCIEDTNGNINAIIDLLQNEAYQTGF